MLELAAELETALDMLDWLELDWLELDSLELNWLELEDLLLPLSEPPHAVTPRLKITIKEINFIADSPSDIFYSWIGKNLALTIDKIKRSARYKHSANRFRWVGKIETVTPMSYLPG